MSEQKEKPTILLVASSVHSIKLVSKHLQEHFALLTAEDAEAAWDLLLKDREIVLVICELEIMINQFGLLERIRSAGDSWLAATPILLLVGENDADAGRELAFQMGATDFINMPFASSELTTRARLHANLYLQHSMESPEELEQVSAANLLQQLSQTNFFNSRAQQELSFAQRHRGNFSLCKLKLDNIKSIMQSFDKAKTTTVVKGVAGIIQQTLRTEDTVCYLGNAEFYLLYPATNGIGATDGVKRILKRVSSSPIRIDDNKVKVTLSGSVYSCLATDNNDLEQIYAQLDTSLVQAQSAGGNRVVSSSASSEEHHVSVDRALKLIQQGSTDELTADAAPLLISILPLLDFADGVLKLGLRSVNSKLREKLNIPSRSDP
ncbi:MAG: diguanylate cyclase [Gammaproteobacteria bacterium]|nr:diguanylate cyclase [Gammaproteobacteria bacterium]